MHVLERERRIAISAKRAVAVEADAPAPAEHADVEVEQPSRVAAGEKDREERDHAHDGERDPEEEEHDEVWDRQQPLDEPEPAAESWRELAGEPERIAGCRGFHYRTSLPPDQATGMGGALGMSSRSFGSALRRGIHSSHLG